MSSVNFTDGQTKRPARTPIRWVVYLTAIGIASFGWIALLAYCALALMGY